MNTTIDQFLLSTYFYVVTSTPPINYKNVFNKAQYGMGFSSFGGRVNSRFLVPLSGTILIKLRFIAVNNNVDPRVVLCVILYTIYFYLFNHTYFFELAKHAQLHQI